MSIKLLVTGTRTIMDVKFIYTVLDSVKDIYGFDEVIVGDATGVDEITQLWCDEKGIPCDEEEAKWHKYGNGAGPIRNIEMVKECDLGIGIWDGKSRGTAHCIRTLREAKKLLMVFRYE